MKRITAASLIALGALSLTACNDAPILSITDLTASPCPAVATSQRNRIFSAW